MKDRIITIITIVKEVRKKRKFLFLVRAKGWG